MSISSAVERFNDACGTRKRFVEQMEDTVRRKHAEHRHEEVGDDSCDSSIVSIGWKALFGMIESSTFGTAPIQNNTMNVGIEDGLL